MSNVKFAAAGDRTVIAYRIEGRAEAPTIVFSHSLGVTSDTWDPQVTALGDSFRVVRYDARGHGRSEAPPGEYDIDMVGRDALAVLDAAAIGTAHFVGLSMGGMVGMWIGIHAPDRLGRLVLANTTPHIPLPPAVWNQRIATASTDGLATIAVQTADRWLGEEFKSSNPLGREAIIATMRGMSAVGYAGTCALLREADQRADIGRIVAPTLVLTGSGDVSTPPAAAEALAAAIPHGRAAVIRGSGHLSNVERPDDFNRAVREFLL